MEQELFYDYRYEFSSILDFFTGGYVFHLEALHLTISLLLLLIISKRIISKNNNIAFSLSIIYFGSTIYNNYAYTLFSITIAEYIGIASAIFYISTEKFKKNIISTYLLIFFFISITHYIFITIINGAIENDSIMRTLIYFKIIVLSINIAILFKNIKNKDDLNKFITTTISLTNIALLAYLIQIFVFFIGVLPYGSFSPAGYAESFLPSFASVSIERGHFGKFLTPLFPLYLYGFLVLKKKKSFFLFLIISTLNMSASSYVFMSLYIILSLIIISEIKLYYKIAVSIIILVIVSVFTEQLINLIDKIYVLAIQQDEEGGRGFEYLSEILLKYPLGYGYAGSTYRDLHGIEGLQLNNAIVAFWGQLSIVGIPIILALGYAYWHMIYKTKFQSLEGKLLLIALIVSIVIFLADILWFIPTIWLSIAILHKASLLRENNQ